MNKIDKETALADFERFCEDWDIDTDVDEFDQEEREDYDKLKKQILRKIKSGNLVYNDNETFTYILVKPFEDLSELTMTRTKGNSYLSMDNYKEKQLVHRGFSKVAALVGKPLSIISKLDDVDLKVLQAVQQIFLGS